MARTIRTKVYLFNELSEDVQQKVIENNYHINVDYNWWESTYDDAKEIGLKITGFDIDRGNYCEGEFLLSANEVAHNIFNSHGEVCKTYKTANDFMNEWQPVFNEYLEKEGYELENKLQELESDFLKSLCEDYLIMLRDEYEYQTSKDQVKEAIISNEYEFTKDGNRF